MNHVHRMAAVAALVLIVAQVASAQSSIFNFEDGTDQGFGLKFSNDASANFPIVNIGGSNRMQIARTGAFQEADHAEGNDGSNGGLGSNFYQAMGAAAANPAGYQIGYDWYVDTGAATFAANHGSFLQLGTYVNTGSGFYAQDTSEATLNGTQLTSGSVFSGHVTVNFATALFTMPPAQTFFRLGLILNGDGTGQSVYYDNITVSPAPEPASLALIGLGLPALALRRRHRA